MTTSHLRGGLFLFGEPKAPDAPLGACRWCGEKLTGKNAERRNYCYPDREHRPCVREWRASHVWSPRIVVRRLARDRGELELRCTDCGFLCERLQEYVDSAGETRLIWRGVRYWEADHEIPLADGGEHSKGNLRCRCGACHKAKTTREARERARRRRQRRAPCAASCD